jgi:hypothetical protein
VALDLLSCGSRSSLLWPTPLIAGRRRPPSLSTRPDPNAPAPRGVPGTASRWRTLPIPLPDERARHRHSRRTHWHRRSGSWIHGRSVSLGTGPGHATSSCSNTPSPPSITITPCPRLPAVPLGSPLSRRKKPSAAPSALCRQPPTCCSFGDDPARRRHPASAPVCIAERGCRSALPSQYADETLHRAW